MTETTNSYLSSALGKTKDLTISAAGKAKELASPAVPNYQISITAAGAFTLAYLTSTMEGCSSGYLEAVLALASTALAANQYGWDNTCKLAISAVHGVGSYASNQYHSMFAKKPEDTSVIKATPADDHPLVAVEEVKAAPAKKR